MNKRQRKKMVKKAVGPLWYVKWFRYDPRKHTITIGCPQEAPQ